MENNVVKINVPQIRNSLVAMPDNLHTMTNFSRDLVVYLQTLFILLFHRLRLDDV